VIMNISDIIIEVFAMESAHLRCEKLAAAGQGDNARDFCVIYLRDAIHRIESFSRTVLSACVDGVELRKPLGIVRSLADYEPVNSIAVRRRIASKLISSERFIV
jgi:hypothetical protein